MVYPWYDALQHFKHRWSTNYFCMHYYTGHSLETFPDQMAAVRDAGHEMFVLFFNILSEIYREQTSTMYCNIADFTDTLTKWALLFPCLTCFQNITNILSSTPTVNSPIIDYELISKIKKRCDTCFTFFLLRAFSVSVIIGTKILCLNSSIS